MYVSPEHFRQHVETFPKNVFSSASTIASLDGSDIVYLFIHSSILFRSEWIGRQEKKNVSKQLFIIIFFITFCARGSGTYASCISFIMGDRLCHT